MVKYDLQCIIIKWGSRCIMIEWSLQTTQPTNRDNVRNSICVIPPSFPLNCVNHGLYTVMHFSRRFPDNFVLWSKTVDCQETACQVLRKRLNGWVPQIYYCDALWFLKFSITVSLGVCWVRKYTNVLRQSSQGQYLNELSVGQKCVSYGCVW